MFGQGQAVVHAAHSFSVLLLSLQHLQLLLRGQWDLMLAHKVAVDVGVDVVIDQTQEFEVLVHSAGSYCQLLYTVQLALLTE